MAETESNSVGATHAGVELVVSVAWLARNVVILAPRDEAVIVVVAF
jgi:hypothetical protein